jgi:hypothetical protein
MGYLPKAAVCFTTIDAKQAPSCIML